MEIKNTVALVTGASRGIGAALVQALLEHGASKVYAAARQEDDLARLRAARDRRIVPVDLDVTHADHVGRVADQARDVKILFNNAGVLDFGSVLDASPAAFNRNFDVNFFGLLNVFPGAVDTDMLKGVEMPKTAPADVASEVLMGIEADREDIFPDPMAKTLYAQWTTDHKAIEHQFAAM